MVVGELFDFAKAFDKADKISQGALRIELPEYALQENKSPYCFQSSAELAKRNIGFSYNPYGFSNPVFTRGYAECSRCSEFSYPHMRDGKQSVDYSMN